jgi:hypothetical protein
MAIIKATYTKKVSGAKASIRYIEHRPGRAGTKAQRTLFGKDGIIERGHAYTLIDHAAKKSTFFRIVISPDPHTEDNKQDLDLGEVTQRTMTSLEAQIQQPIQWVAAEHDDHTNLRHVHILAIVPESLQTHHFQALRETATAACEAQRQVRDLAREHTEEEAHLERQR